MSDPAPPAAALPALPVLALVRDLIFAERNWHDYAARGRAVRSERFKYIKNDDNAMPLTPPADATRSPTYRAMRRLRDEGKLTPPQRACWDFLTAGG